MHSIKLIWHNLSHYNSCALLCPNVYNLKVYDCNQVVISTSEIFHTPSFQIKHSHFTSLFFKMHNFNIICNYKLANYERFFLEEKRSIIVGVNIMIMVVKIIFIHELGPIFRATHFDLLDLDIGSIKFGVFV